MAAHIEGCRACAAQAADFQRIGRTLAEAGREPMPKALALRVRANLAREAEEDRGGRIAPRRRPRSARRSPRAVRARARCCGRRRWSPRHACSRRWRRGGSWARLGKTSRLEQEVLAAHVRSLLQDSPIQVASSDAHTVKPWFAGRIDFAPGVKDLAAEGFPLLGGRLDYVGGRRVGAVVYKRRLHTINVFMWPSASPGDAAPRLVARNGYNLLAWSRGGVAYWAVSDLNAGDLGQLQGLLLRRGSDPLPKRHPSPRGARAKGLTPSVPAV